MQIGVLYHDGVLVHLPVTSNSTFSELSNCTARCEVETVLDLPSNHPEAVVRNNDISQSLHTYTSAFPHVTRARRAPYHDAVSAQSCNSKVLKLNPADSRPSTRIGNFHLVHTARSSDP